MEKETSIAHIVYHSSGFLKVELKEMAEIEVENIKELHHCFGEMLNGKKVPFLIIPGQYSYISKEAREYNSGANLAAFCSFQAIIIKYLPHRLMTRFHIKARKNQFPVKVFSSEKEALIHMVKKGLVSPKAMDYHRERTA